MPAGMAVSSPLARKIMSMFVVESRRQLSEIERAAVGADTQALNRAAHSLKSSSATVGASRVSAIAKALEVLVRAGKTADLVDLSARLQLELQRFGAEPALVEMISSKGSDRAVA